ncbi:MAG: hypothetical protein HUJ30_04210 [Gammaproteobacteria bacterium]|nr:hypothetical protein [Gammaproteobacteria bacterium]
MKLLYSLASAWLLLLAPLAYGQSTILDHETAGYVDEGDIEFSIYNYGGNPDIRIGINDAEVFIRHDTANAAIAGYKADIGESLAVYGGLGIEPLPAGGATNTLLAGVTYTQNKKELLLNANAEMVNDSVNNILLLKLAGYYILTDGKPGNIRAGLSIDADLSSACTVDCTVTKIGVNWEVKKNIVFEAAVYNSLSGLQLPGTFNLKLTF